MLSRAWLLDLLRGREPKAYDRTTDNITSRLRRKIGDDDRAEKLIVTEWGSGYRLAATVEVLRPGRRAQAPRRRPAIRASVPSRHIPHAGRP